MKSPQIVGTSVPRLEGRDKVTGKARYIDDMELPDMLYGATVRSRIARGKINKINFGSAVNWGTDNTFKTYLIEKDDVDAVWKYADHIIEGEYTTGAQEQLYIENNGMIARFDVDQGLTVWGSIQCPYYVHKALMKLCDLP